MSLTGAEKRSLEALMMRLAKRRRKTEIAEETSWNTEDEEEDIQLSRRKIIEHLETVGLEQWRAMYEKSAEKKEEESQTGEVSEDCPTLVTAGALFMMQDPLTVAYMHVRWGLTSHMSCGRPPIDEELQQRCQNIWGINSSLQFMWTTQYAMTQVLTDRSKIRQQR
ncbi:unnamed protein product [Symbiodinium sp. CCMP2592]|nr:unnamed protein product [Symbiodinium sp. CCMP2592]CAE7831484.1 unnamed protein product [Symbiodinium sp. CCMP2592]